MAVYSFSKNSKNKKNKNVAKIVGISLLVVCSFAFLCLFTNLIIPVRDFFLGVFGLFSYPMFLTLFVVGLALINNKKYVMSKKYVAFLSLAIVFLLAIIQLIIIGGKSGNFWQYWASNYNNKLTAGGFVIGFLTTVLNYTVGIVGSYIITCAGFIVFAGLTADCIYYAYKNEHMKKGVKVQIKPVKEKKVLSETTGTGEEINVVLDGNIKEELTKEEEALKKLGLLKGERANILKDETKSSADALAGMSRKEYILSKPSITEIYHPITKGEETRIKDFTPSYSMPKSISEQEVNETMEKLKEENKPPKIIHEEFIESENNETLSFSETDDIADGIEKIIRNETKSQIEEMKEPKKFVQIDMNASTVKAQEAPKTIKEETKPQVAIYHNYVRPPIDLLTTNSVDLSTLNEDVVGKRELLEKSLEEFGINAKVIGVVVGPSVTRYELEMPPGISVRKITSHADDIALALAANGGIRIEAPIPGRSAVGVEVPNENIATIGIKDIISSKEFNSSRSPLTFSLGKDISGTVKICNLQKMPHLLVAGSTGSGKSVCLNSIIISLIYKASPDELRLILIDPKRVEFSMYEGLPHLMLPNIITDSEKAINALNWAVSEMEDRYKLLQETKTRNIEEYNSLDIVTSGKTKKIPYLVIIVDELCDLMMVARKEIEDKIVRLAQKSRAAGIHLILATQRPSVDVITGTIKINLPSRIAFAVTNFADSSTILGQGGAEKLLGKGDMLYAPADAAEPKRIQGCFVSSNEVDSVVDFVKENNVYEYDSEVEQAINSPNKNRGNGSGEREMELDPLFADALRIIIENGQASTNLIQRRLVVGYPRAARIIDQMQQANYISAPDGTNKPRSVYITMEEYNKLFGDGE